MSQEIVQSSDDDTITPCNMCKTIMVFFCPAVTLIYWQLQTLLVVMKKKLVVERLTQFQGVEK